MTDPTKNPSFEYELIGDVVKEDPEMSKIMKKYFGEDCLRSAGFKIQTLKMACILFGVDQTRLLKELEDLRN
jgi:hypothetical protein